MSTLGVVYIYPEGGAGHHRERALKFIDSYHQHPPMMDHVTAIVCNGAPANEETRFMFSSLPNPVFIEHDDSGWDIGGFQRAARDLAHLMMIVFCGGNSYFRRAGWMIHAWEAFRKNGDTLYGSTGNTGDMNVGVFPHVRTTGFWCSPALMNNYPHRITERGSHGQRYEFEHGRTGFTTWVMRQNKLCYIVAWDGVYSLDGANSIPNGFRQGNQTNILIGDRLTQVPYGTDP